MLFRSKAKVAADWLKTESKSVLIYIQFSRSSGDKMERNEENHTGFVPQPWDALTSCQKMRAGDRCPITYFGYIGHIFVYTSYRVAEILVNFVGSISSEFRD